MSLFRKVLLGIGGVIILLTLAAYLLPRNVHVERSTVIAAPRATVFTIVNSFTHFNKWSPWAALDPTAKYTFEGPVAGVGARMSWVGDPSTMGSGSQVITASTPWEAVTTDIDFGPQGRATGRFTLTAQGPATHVVWALDTDLGMNPVSRYFGLMFDGMIGRDFEKGLAGLKKLAEGMPKGDFAELAVEMVDVAPVTVAYVPTSSGRDDASIAAAIGKAYGEIGAFMKPKSCPRTSRRTASLRTATRGPYGWTTRHRFLGPDCGRSSSCRSSRATACERAHRRIRGRRGRAGFIATGLLKAVPQMVLEGMIVRTPPARRVLVVGT